MSWLDTLIDQVSGGLSKPTPEQLEAQNAVRLSAEERQRFDDSRGYMRDQELRSRDQAYMGAIAAAPTVRYTDTTPTATERGNRTANLPVPLVERIATTAQSAGVDPYKALAIALMETNGGTNKSYNSAINPLFENGGRSKSEFDMVPTAIAHIKLLEARFPNNPDKATRAYNGLGKSYIPQTVSYPQRIKDFSSSLMAQPDLVDIINNAKKR